MPRFGYRSACSVALAASAIAAGGMASPALAALPRTYQVQTIKAPNLDSASAVEGHFGVALVNAGDVNGDGKDDVLVGTDEHGGAFAGTVHVLSGADGSILRSLPPPDPGGAGNGSAWGGFVGKIGDLGSCAGGTPSVVCPGATIGAPDGVPDELVTALGVDVPFTGGGGGTLVDAGRAYVIDGATGAVLKRIDMPNADLLDQSTKPGPPKPAFGRTILSPAGLPPCAGNMGIGTCASMPNAVKIGDMDGGGKPDIIVDASDIYETGATANPTSNCAAGGASAQCLQAGRSYWYSGEAVAGSNPSVVDNTPYVTIKNPAAQADEIAATTNHNRENLGYSIEPVGDLGKCNNSAGGQNGPGLACLRVGGTGGPDSSTNPDGRPDVVISSHRTDDFGMDDAGQALLFDGKDGTLLATYRHPEPQPASLFGFSNYNQPAIGDVGSGTNADVYQAAMRQNNPTTGGGKGYLMNGNFLQSGSPNAISFATLNDPTPNPSEDFGTSSAGVGNVAGTETSSNLDARNEVMVGAYGPHNPGTNQSVINDVHIFSPLTEQELQRFNPPDQQPGLGFGNALAPVGDLNGDGFLDYAIGAGLYDDVASNGNPVPNAGRIYIYRSDNSPAPRPGPPPAGSPVPPGSTVTAAVTQGGRSVDLDLSRHTLRRGQRLKLAGDVESLTSSKTCEQRVAVELQRRVPGRVPYQTFGRLTASGSGRFSTSFKPTRTYLYRALVRQSTQCLASVSSHERVTVTKPRSSRRARRR
ncbi:MAG: hypothetical protein M3Z33_06345 [Actinomycetota bacterium]|nr:hypothetical protein [Actinomycetota bacterium]